MTQLTNIRGVIRGRTIELEQDVSVPDGEVVIVAIMPVQPATPNVPSQERLEAAAGALAGLDDEIDEFNRWYRDARWSDPANWRKID